jgi:hypothetical protein
MSEIQFSRIRKGRRGADADVELELRETLLDVLVQATDVHVMLRTRSAKIVDARTALILSIPNR